MCISYLPSTNTYGQILVRICTAILHSPDQLIQYICITLLVPSRPSRNLAHLLLTRLEMLCNPINLRKEETLSLSQTLTVLYTALSKHLSKTRAFASDQVTVSIPYNKTGKQYDINNSAVVISPD